MSLAIVREVVASSEYHRVRRSLAASRSDSFQKLMLFEQTCLELVAHQESSVVQCLRVPESQHPAHHCKSSPVGSPGQSAQVLREVQHARNHSSLLCRCI